MTDLARLSDPFAPEKVSWRVGSVTRDKAKGMALAYIDARDVMERLDHVCGPAGWQCRYPHANGKTVCDIGIRCGDDWVWKSNGAGDTDIESEKGALSDAFKRAAVLWGIGRYLYDIESPWVELDDGKRIKPGEYARLRRLLGGAAPSQTNDRLPVDEGRARFIQETNRRITGFSDPEKLGEWWNSDEQKKQRRDFGLSIEDVTALKNQVLARRAQITRNVPVDKGGNPVHPMMAG